VGLDTVELVIAFEEEFGVAIDNEDAEKMETPGDVADYVVSRVRTSSDDPCLSQVGFYRIRSLLMDEFSIPRETIHPNTLLIDVVAGNIRENWLRLKNAIGTDNFPKLQRKPVLVFAVVFGLPGLVSLYLYMSGVSGSLVFISFGVLAVIANQLTSNLGSIIPSNSSTVASLIPFVSCAGTKIWSRDEVLVRVFEITAEQLGIKMEDISEKSHFIHDLGAD
jgi:acyl carrier protein